MSKRSAFSYRRSSRLADPFSRNITVSLGTTWPWTSTSCSTHRACTGDGASNRSVSSTTLGTSDRSAATSASWPGCSASSWAMKPTSRVVVSLPAPAMVLV
jgi:hypothetical protein